MEERVISINYGMSIALDYIDLKGELQSLTLEVSNESDAVDNLRTVWNSNLLWFFKLHLKQHKPISQIRSIPYSANVLRKALAFPRLHQQIQGLRQSFSLYESKVLSSLSTSNSGHLPQDVGTLADTFSKLRALEAVKDGLIKELEKYGIQLEGLLNEERVQALEHTARAVKSLDEMKTDKSFQDAASFVMGRVRRIKGSELLNYLPRVSGIFSNEQEHESVPFVEISNY